MRVRSDQHPNLEVPSALFTLAPWHGARALRSRVAGQGPAGLWSIPVSCGALSFLPSSDTTSQCPSICTFYTNVSSRWLSRRLAIFSPQMVSSHSVPFEVRRPAVFSREGSSTLQQLEQFVFARSVLIGELLDLWGCQRSSGFKHLTADLGRDVGIIALELKLIS